MLPQELLERLEAHWLSDTPAPELEAELRALPSTEQAEAEEYQQLFRALQAAQATQMRERFADWDNDFAQADEAEYIDAYLQGELHPDNAAALETRLKHDEVLAQSVSQQARLEEGFAALNDEQFRAQMNKWEGSSQGKVRQLKPRPAKRWLAIAATVLVLATAGLFGYQANQYSDQALAEQYYQRPVVTGNNMGSDAPTRTAYLNDFAAAHAALEAGDYRDAMRAFDALAATPPPAGLSDEEVQYYQDNADWNNLLSRLGAGQIGIEFEQRLQLITGSSTHLYHQQALELEEDLDIFWRF